MKNNTKLIFIQLNEINFDILSKYSAKFPFKFFTSFKNHNQINQNLL